MVAGVVCPLARMTGRVEGVGLWMREGWGVMVCEMGVTHMSHDMTQRSARLTERCAQSTPNTM